MCKTNGSDGWTLFDKITDRKDSGSFPPKMWNRNQMSVETVLIPIAYYVFFVLKKPFCHSIVV